MSPTENEIILDVLIEHKDLDKAVVFYRKALDLNEASKVEDSSWKLSLGQLVLHICSRPWCEDSKYRKGETPRLELRVHDVDASIRRAVEAGGSVRCRIAKDHIAAEDEPASYAQVLDPYGHLWSFAHGPEHGTGRGQEGKDS